ncbi:MAG: hypothetical protein R3E83_00220 [Burkholderiaceae bacterium]
MASLLLLELISIVTHHLPWPALLWLGDATRLLLLAFGWIGAAHLWLSRGHLRLSQRPASHPNRHDPRWMLADALMLVGCVWLLPKILQTMDVYASLLMPVIDLSAGAKFAPMACGVSLLALAAALNLLIDLSDPARGRAR